MREFLRTPIVRWVHLGWFWTAVLLVLPNCTFNPGGLAPGSNITKGSTPHNDLIFCDIERPESRHCSDALERARGIRLSEAAIALAEGRSSDVGLDDSAAALARCGGEPEAVFFQGPFPQGFPVCLNCGEAIGTATQPTVTVACQKQCLDFFGTIDAEGNLIPNTSPDPAVVDFCNAASRPSTGIANDMCLVGACSDGAVRDDFVDPRRFAEPVVWRDLIGVAAGGPAGNDLTRTAAETGDYDAGAVSTQWFTHGDGFVEFAAGNTAHAMFAGLRVVPAACPAPCPDSDTTYTNINYAVFLRTGRLDLVENGTLLMGPDVDGSFGTYTPADRLRVYVRDNGDGTATVRYTRLIGACTPGTVCAQTTLHTSTVPASYPLRVDVSIRDGGATLTDVRVVRIR